MTDEERATIKRMAANPMAWAMLKGAVRAHWAGKPWSSWWLLLHAGEVVS